MPTAQGHWKNSSTINDITMTKLASVTKKNKQDLLQKKYNEPMRYDMHVDFIGQDSQEQPWKTIPRRRFPSK